MQSISGKDIFFLLWVKYPKLLYINYGENARLLAWWLEVQDVDRDFDGLDAYSMNLLASIANYSLPRVVLETHRAIEKLKARKQNAS